MEVGAVDERMVGAAKWRILTDLVVTFDGQTERSLIRCLALKARVAKEALKRLLEQRRIYAMESKEGPKYFVTEEGRRLFWNE
jgi:predicted transcriptional regulator